MMAFGLEMQSNSTEMNKKNWWTLFFLSSLVCVGFFFSFYQDTEKWGAQISFSSSNAWNPANGKCQSFETRLYIKPNSLSISVSV